LQYSNIEQALANIMGVKPVQMGAFRARLRHFRNIGLPKLPKLGSGHHVDYTQKDALEMLLALELQKIGQTAAHAALVAGSIVRMTGGQHVEPDSYVLCQKEQVGYTIAIGTRALIEAIKKGPPAVSLINVSACVRNLKRALKPER
jgi:hypothetical protein